MANHIDYTPVVKIITSDGSGTGFFFRRPNYFITNFHVVEGYRDVTVELQDEERFRASVLLVSQHLDLAIIRVEGDFEKWTPLEFCEEDALQLSDKIVVGGFALGKPFSITEGVVSSPRQKADGRYLIQTDAAVNPGNSGGPMFNSEGKVCAVVVSKIKGAENVGFGIPIADVKKVFKALGEISDEERYYYQCPGCDNPLMDETAKFCPSCGADIPREAFNEKTKSDFTKLGEEIIRAIGIDPLLANNGDEDWKFYYKGALIRAYDYGRSFIIFLSNINLLPKQELQPLFEYMLSNPVAPYQLGIRENDVVLYSCIHLTDLQNEKHRDRIIKELAALPEKAAELDDFLNTKFGCRFPERKDSVEQSVEA